MRGLSAYLYSLGITALGIGYQCFNAMLINGYLKTKQNNQTANEKKAHT